MARTTNGKVGRTVTRTLCSCAKELDGTRTFFSTELYGSYDAARAQRELRRREHDSTITVLECEITSAYYSMALDDFIKYAEVADKE